MDEIEYLTARADANDAIVDAMISVLCAGAPGQLKALFLGVLQDRTTSTGRPMHLPDEQAQEFADRTVMMQDALKIRIPPIARGLGLPSETDQSDAPGGAKR